MARDNLYSRTVFIAKLVLPLVAIALLSTVFLLAKRPNPEDAIPFASVDVAERAREQRLTAPRFTGESEDGASFSLTAEVARPDPINPRRMRADAVSLAVDGLRGDGTLHVRAATGAIDTERRHLRLLGDVAVRSSLGFVMRTDALLTAFDTFEVTSPGEVRGMTPFGSIVAGRMRLGSDADSDRQLLLFEGGVDLLYEPGTP